MLTLARVGVVVLLPWVVGCDLSTVEHEVTVVPLHSAGVLERPVPEDQHLLEMWASRLRLAEEDVRIGSLDSVDAAHLLGDVRDVLEDQDGNLLILDGHYSNLRIFSAGGKHLHTFGSRGRGPGEFMQPSAMVWWSPGELIVVDRTRRAQVVGYTPPGSVEYRRELSTELAVESVCRAPTGVWVHGLDPTSESLVQMLDVDEGGLKAGWGDPLTLVENPILQMRLDIGRMDCANEAGAGFLLTSYYFPYVRSFDADGQERWHTTLDSFQPMRFTLVSRDGRVGLRQGIASDADGFHRIQSVVALDKRMFLVQVGWVDREGAESGDAYTSLESFLFTADTGASLPLNESLPLIHNVTPTGVLGSFNAPFPQVVRMTFADTGGRE